MNDQSLLPMAIPHGAHWAIEESAANQLLALLRSESASSHTAQFESKNGMGRGESGRRYDAFDKGVAMISVSGALTKAPTSLDGGTSTVYLRRTIRAAANDPDVDSIILLIDSPGGSVSGTELLANDVAMAAKKKPCYAVVEDQCCSAAYWIASQCNAIYANETAMLGSIGTYMALFDASKMYESAGIEVLVFKTGPKKGAGVFGSNITDEQKEAFQQTVDDLNAHFLAAVNRGRKLSLEAGIGVADGGVLIGKQAVDAGLIDGIGALDEVFAMCVKPSSREARMEEGGTTFVLTDSHEVRQIGDQMLITTKETNSRDDRSLAGLTLADETEAALAAVSGLTARFADLKADRELEGRELSEKARSHVESIKGALETALQSCKAILETQIDSSIRDQLSRAMQDAELALSIPI